MPELVAIVRPERYAPVCAALAEREVTPTVYPITVQGVSPNFRKGYMLVMKVANELVEKVLIALGPPGQVPPLGGEILFVRGAALEDNILPVDTAGAGRPSKKMAESFRKDNRRRKKQSG